MSTVASGRLCIFLAALLWILSGAFTKTLTQDTFLGVNDPPLAPIQMACWRALFAGLFLVPTLRRADIRFRPLMLVMALCFALMNVSFVSAMALGKAANAILLQYTAPLWLYLVAIFWFREPSDRRGV